MPSLKVQLEFCDGAAAFRLSLVLSEVELAFSPKGAQAFPLNKVKLQFCLLWFLFSVCVCVCLLREQEQG